MQEGGHSTTQVGDLDQGLPDQDGFHSTRIHLIDCVRGFSVISMVLFHLCYDLSALWFIPLPWFNGLPENIWRNSISWTFLVLAGISCCYSRNNFKRALKLLILAFLIWVGTTIADIDTPISFGVIFCLGACALLESSFEHVDVKPVSIRANLLLMVTLGCMFAATLHAPSGYLSLPVAGAVRLPTPPYDCGVLSWAGFPGVGFESGDYYPLIPFAFLYFSGMHIGRVMRQKESSLARHDVHCVPLEFVGRHALLIYVSHQIILVAALTLLLGLTMCQFKPPKVTLLMFRFITQAWNSLSSTRYGSKVASTRRETPRVTRSPSSRYVSRTIRQRS